MTKPDTPEKKNGQRLALIIAAVAILWMLANFIGTRLEFSNRTRALIDLFALAGFGWAIWQALAMWRQRK
ncbi:MAG: DUF5337 domain-containing protein [Rhodobacteraceae bacterium]|nr:DUF5337 domain-containing protein [Paracoccaceae bacterium]